MQVGIGRLTRGLFRDSFGWLVAKFLQLQPEVQQKFFNCRRFNCSVVVVFNACLEKDYNTVVETSAIEEHLLNFGLELKKLRDI